MWARIAPSFGGLWRLQTFVCVRGVSANPHIYPSVLQAVPGWGRTGRLEGTFRGYQAGPMQDLGYELRRIPIPRTPVNKGIREGAPVDSRRVKCPQCLRRKAAWLS